MPETLLQTKLYIPPLRPNRVSRSPLIDRLNQGLQQGCNLTLVSAPAGFGKTTLVSAWVRQSHQSIAWFSLDEGDNDPARFLLYLASALNQVKGTGAAIGQGALGLLQSAQDSSYEPILISLINDISIIPASLILILDDYHLIESPPVDAVLTFLLEHLPPQLHLVIVTRSDPNLPFARYRARGRLTELRATDLRFTSSEAAKFLNQVMGLNLSAADIAALESRTEGWIAGLQLAALALQGPISMKGRQDAASFIKSFTGSHHFVLDYLIEEVFEQQPESAQTFLLKTAILNRLTGSLCDALTGRDDSRLTLEMLDHANLFVVPLDEERRWYRYHHLFSDLLRQRLRQTQPHWVPVLHHQASEWYEQNGFAEEAIEHALKSEDFQRAAALIEEHVEHVLQFGEHARLRRWLAEIPVEVTFSRPHLCILHAGNLYISGHIDEAEPYLQAAERALEKSQSPDPDLMKLRGRVAVVRSFLVSYHGEIEGAIQYARQALEYLPQSDATWRASAFDGLASAYSVIDEESAYQARLEALEASKTAGNAYMILFASLRLVVTLRDLGRLQDAIEICQEQLNQADENGLSQTSLVGWLYTLWGEILAEKNELDQAFQLANKGVALTERGKDVILLSSSYLCLMRVLFSKGALDAANDFIQEVNNSPHIQELSPWITNQLAAWQARIWLAQGNLDAAQRWADRCELDVHGELEPLHDFDYGVFARLLIARGRSAEASQLLERLLEAAETGRRISKTIELLILQALAFHAGAETNRALSTLEQAFKLAEPEGFIRTFIDEGLPLARLLQGAFNRGIAPAYSRHLLAAYTLTESKSAGKPTSAPNQSALIEPLSERELEVLQGITQGLTNQEIADRLYLSLNTIKVHTRNIYGKLNVHSRTQAIARAQELGLLLPPPD